MEAVLVSVRPEEYSHIRAFAIQFAIHPTQPPFPEAFPHVAPGGPLIPRPAAGDSGPIITRENRELNSPELS